MELYSQREKTSKNVRTAYRYDLPIEFRNQVIHIWKDAIGYRENHVSNELLDTQFPERFNFINAQYARVNDVLREELGYMWDELSPFWSFRENACLTLRTFFCKADTDNALDVIELTFETIFQAQRDSQFMSYVQPKLKASDAVVKLNVRFRENAIGYRLEHGRIIRIDSEFLHAEAIEPAIQLMYAQGYEGPFQEFMLAQKHYRHGPEHYDDCLTNCGKSLESTLKTICVRRKWKYNPLDTASKLFDSVFSYGLIPAYLQSHFSGLRCALESGVPTIRNREGGHGSGEKPNEVPEYLAAYQLHLTASAIVFLIRANEDFDKRKP